MSRVDGNISDLFFNTEHVFGDGDYPELQQEAQDFLDCLDRLGVATPNAGDLIADFMNRL